MSVLKNNPKLIDEVTDAYDTIEWLIKNVTTSADVKRVRAYLQQYASDLLPRFEELVAEALTD